MDMYEKWGGIDKQYDHELPMDMYEKWEGIDKSHKLFDQIFMQSVILWTAIDTR